MISQYWFRYWLGGIRHQAITWANIDSNLKILCCHKASLDTIWSMQHFILLERVKTTSMVYECTKYLVYQKVIIDVTIRLDNAENQSSGWLLRKPTMRAKCVEVGTRINMTQCVNDHPFVEPSVWWYPCVFVYHQWRHMCYPCVLCYIILVCNVSFTHHQPAAADDQKLT